MIKSIHLLTVVVSIALFFMRGVWIFRDSAVLQQRWVKILPHANDTVLLISAITLAITIQQYPFVHGWVTTKVILLVIYILLGMVAFKWGRAKPIRVVAWLSAMGVYGYIILVALTKNPLWFV